MKRESFNSIILGVGIFTALLLLAMAKTKGGFSPFTLGFFVALVYARRNFLVVSPLYVLANFIINPTLYVLFLSALPVAIFAIVYFVHYKMKKEVGLFTVNLFSFVSAIPTVLLNLYFGETIFYVGVHLLLSQMFTICATVCLYAVMVRGLKTRFTTDELICSAVTVTALSIGLFSVEAFGVRPFFIVCALVCLVMTYSLGSIGLVTAVTFGLGASFSGDVTILAPIVFAVLGALAFRTVSPYVCAISYCVCAVALGLYFGTNFSMIDGGCTVFGGIIFCALPRRVKKELGAYLTAFREPHGDRRIVNRNRRAISERLAQGAKVFWELSGVVSDTARVMSEEERVECVEQEVDGLFCGNCTKREECDRILSGKRRELIHPLVVSAVKKGKATLLELPAYVTGSCIKVNELIPLVNSVKEKFFEEERERGAENVGKMVFAEQLIGVGEMLACLSQDTGRIIGFDLGRERVLIDELAYKNVLCAEAIIEESGDSVTLLVKEGEARMRAIEKVTSKVMKKKMRAKIERTPRHHGFDSVILTPSPRFDMAFGEAVEMKTGEDRNGDSRLVSRPSVDTYILAIADGMGSGEGAERASSTAVSLVESFYKAGFSHKTVINMVNKMLTFTDSERYNTLDMCICNVREGKCDFIKMGSCASYLKRGEKVEVVESGALPMGVLQEVSPTIVEKEVENGDMLVLVSDGVTDSIGEEGLLDFISRENTPNPQVLARKIRSIALKRGKASDDVSVVVGKIFG